MIVDVAPPGAAVELEWRPVAGATRAELTRWAITITPRVVVQSLGRLDHERADKDLIVHLPPRERVRSLTLAGLRLPKVVGNEIRYDRPRNTEELRDLSRRLVVRVPGTQSAWSPPVYAMPAVDAAGMVPKLLLGASFEGGVLTLPDLEVPRIRLSIASGSSPNGFSSEIFELDEITGEAALLPRDLTVTDAAGRLLWSFPGDMPASLAAVDIDLRRAGERVINAALAAGEAPRGRFRIAAARRAEINLDVTAAEGALVRVVPGTVRIDLDGDPVALPVSPPLGERPAGAAADLRVRYRGLRLVRELSDPVPPGTSGGVVVGEAGAVRVLPPAAFTAAPARIALIGRAAEDCELVVEVVDHAAGAPGAVLTRASLAVAAARRFAAHWVELPPVALTGAIALRARANRGRFLWAGDPLPRIRVAVADADPGGRALRIGGLRVADVREVDRVDRGRELAAAFRSGHPAFDSDLFLTVELSELTMRHAR